MVFDWYRWLYNWCSTSVKEIYEKKPSLHNIFKPRVGEGIICLFTECCWKFLTDKLSVVYFTSISLNIRNVFDVKPQWRIYIVERFIKDITAYYINFRGSVLYHHLIITIWDITIWPRPWPPCRVLPPILTLLNIYYFIKMVYMK